MFSPFPGVSLIREGAPEGGVPTSGQALCFRYDLGKVGQIVEEG